MSEGGASAMQCPICKKEVAADAPDFPFCSARCRIIDLGNWAAEKYVVASPAEGTAANEKEDDE